MKPVTYSLYNDNKDTSEYYDTVSQFASEIIEQGNSMLGRHLDDYMNYLEKFNLEELRSREEYLLELLSFGILWEAYGRYSVRIKFAPFVTLSNMGEWRKKHQNLKPYIDAARGILISLFLLPKSALQSKNKIPNLPEVDKVCQWFEATGEFREQALRFVRWRAYWGSFSVNERENIFIQIAGFTGWFKQRANEVLGRYTEGVEEFLAFKKNFYRWREDRISCMRSRDEYHLNMAGAEIMNRAFKPEYSNTEVRAILLPGCMRINQGTECKAIKEKKGLKCIGCEKECRVNELRLLAKKEKAEVYVIPHASDLSLWAPEKEGLNRGVIASACVTTLVEGGWELKRYGVPAQCVLLNYSGCKKHWTAQGVETELSCREVEKRLS